MDFIGRRSRSSWRRREMEEVELLAEATERFRPAAVAMAGKANSPDSLHEPERGGSSPRADSSIVAVSPQVSVPKANSLGDRRGRSGKPHIVRIFRGDSLKVCWFGKKRYNQKEIYDTRDSRMVTHYSTSRAIRCLDMAERTGSLVIHRSMTVDICIKYIHYMNQIVSLKRLCSGQLGRGTTGPQPTR